jgi:predicted RNA-binding protein with RPS1 domain
MGLIREPLNVDFEVEPKMLTKEEKEKISKYIKEFQLSETAKQKNTTKKKTIRKKTFA